MSRRKYDFTTDHSKGVKSGAVTFIKQQPLIIVDGPGEDSPEEDCPRHLERSDSGVSDVTMTVNSMMPTETGTPSEGACSNHHDQRESGIFDGDGDLARTDTDCNRFSTLSTDSGRPSSMEGILDNVLPLQELANNTDEEEHHRDAANNSDPTAAKEEATEQIAELTKKPWRFSKLEHSRPRRYSGSPNPSLPPLDNELKDSNFDILDKMMPRIGSGARTKRPECLKIPPENQSSNSQAGQQLGTSLPSDDLMTDCASPGVDGDPPFGENENMNLTTTRETRPEPATSGSHCTEHGGHQDVEDMTYGRITKTWDHDDSCVIMPVYDARGKFSHTGGCLELRYGRTTVRLDVPGGAVPQGEDRELFIRVLPSRGRVEPTAVFCGPHGTVFETPVTLSYSTDDDGGKAAVQGFLTPTDFGDPTRWHDIGDDPDTSFKAEDGMHHFMLKHFTGLTSGANSAPKRTNPQQQDHIIKTFHLYHDYQVFEADGKRMTFLILRLYIADEDRAENIEASEKKLGGRPSDAPRCLTFTVDNDNPLQISLTHPFEHAWNFVGPHLQTMDIRTIRGTRLTSCQFRMSSAHNAAMPAHCNVELSQPGNSSVTLGVNIVPPQQLQCCCQGRPNRQLEYERHCHNNTGYEESDPEDHLQGAVGGYLTASHLPVSQCAEETGSVQQKGKHPVEDACPCQNCQVHMEGQSCPTDDTYMGCHLCTEESSSQTSVPTYPGTTPEEPYLHLSTEESSSPTLEPTHPGTTPGQPYTHLCTEGNSSLVASHHHQEESQPDSQQQGAVANSPVPLLQLVSKSQSKKKHNLRSRIAQMLPIGKQNKKSKSSKVQASPEVVEYQEATTGENAWDPKQPDQEAIQAMQPSKKDSAYISGVPEEAQGAERVGPNPEDHQHLRDWQGDSGIHGGEGSCAQLPSTGLDQVSEDQAEVEEATTGENRLSDTHHPNQQAIQATQPSKKDSAYISGVPEEADDEESVDLTDRNLQRDSGIHGGDATTELDQVQREQGNPVEDTTGDGNNVDKKISIQQTGRTDQASKKDSAYISGVPEQCQGEGEAEDLHGTSGDSLKPHGEIDT